MQKKGQSKKKVNSYCKMDDLNSWGDLEQT